MAYGSVGRFECDTTQVRSSAGGHRPNPVQCAEILAQMVILNVSSPDVSACMGVLKRSGLPLTEGVE